MARNDRTARMIVSKTVRIPHAPKPTKAPKFIPAPMPAHDRKKGK